MNADEIKADCREYRDQIKTVAGDVLALRKQLIVHAETGDISVDADLDEARANVMLSYRHLEDARMRLGKVIQALEGGVSILDRPPFKDGVPAPSSQ